LRVVGQFEIAVMNNQAKRPYSNASTSEYSIGFLARSTFELFITAVPVTVPYMARDNGISERAKHKSGWFRMLSCPMRAMLSRFQQPFKLFDAPHVTSQTGFHRWN
jgi:hypothetical protein